MKNSNILLKSHYAGCIAMVQKKIQSSCYPGALINYFSLKKKDKHMDFGSIF